MMLQSTPADTRAATRAGWQELFAQDHCAPPTAAPEWADALISQTSWRDATRLFHTASGRVLVPMVQRLTPAGVVASGWPHGWGEDWVLTDPGVPPRAVCEVLNQVGRGRAITTVAAAAGQEPLWRNASWVEGQRSTHLLQVSEGYDAVAARFSRDARYSIRRAERAGVRVVNGNSPEQVAAFGLLYRASLRRWALAKGRPPIVVDQLVRLQDRTAQLAAVLATVAGAELRVAYLDERPVAANVTLLSPGWALGWIAALDKEAAGKSRANALLVAQTIRGACERGVAQFDLGESDPGSATEHWKRQFGAEVFPRSTFRAPNRAGRILSGALDSALRLARRPVPSAKEA